MAETGLRQKPGRMGRPRHASDLVIELDEIEAAQIRNAAKQVGMAVEELARHIIEQSLDRFQEKVVTERTEPH
ncbi:MAG: hypothetical protein U9R74_16720 [Pseudomonadota bacterium]|nr:hypothetical protein [Pseudomonadota bacterium]